jgi:hypothetical protein
MHISGESYSMRTNSKNEMGFTGFLLMILSIAALLVFFYWMG